MAKSKSSNKKNLPSKNAQKQSRKLSGPKSIRRSIDLSGKSTKIILEVVLKSEHAATVPRKTTFSLKTANLIDVSDSECPDNKFKYSFDKTNDVTILSLLVGGYKMDLPPDDGEFTTCIFDPNDPPSITVVVVAKKNNPGGRAAFSLSFNDKKVYADPRELDNKGHGMLGIMEPVKLPV